MNKDFKSSSCVQGNVQEGTGVNTDSLSAELKKSSVTVTPPMQRSREGRETVREGKLLSLEVSAPLNLSESRYERLSES